MAIITISATTNQTPIRVTTATPHGRANGDTVIVRDVLTNTPANGTWTVLVQDANNIFLVGSVGIANDNTGGKVIVPSTITNATNASPIVVTTSANHGFLSGDLVTVSAVGGTTAANGTWTVTVLSATTFSLNASVGNSAYTSGGTVTPFFGARPITNATNTAPIIITSAGHGLTTGQSVIVSGVGGNTAANGMWLVRVVDADTFSLTCDMHGTPSAGNGAYTSGGGFTVATPTNDTTGDTHVLSIRENSGMIGTGDIVLAGAVPGYWPFSVVQDQQVVNYRIDVVDASGVPTGVFENGVGVYSTSTNTIRRVSVGSNSDGTTTPLSVPAGRKIISSQIDVTTPPHLASEGSPFTMGGVLSAAGEAVLTFGDSEFGTRGRGPIVNLVPIHRPPLGNIGLPVPPPSVIDKVTLMYAAWVVVNGARSAQRAFVDVTIWDYTLATSELRRNTCDMSIASRIPFAYNAGLLAAQDYARAFIPADIFAYLPSVGPITSGLSVRPILFYLNWMDANTRGFSITNFPAAAVPDNTIAKQSYLDMTGAFVTETDELLKDPKRYLYLGTVCGLRDRELTNRVRERLIWNRYNKLPFRDDPRTDGDNGFGSPVIVWASDRADFFDVANTDGSLARLNYGELTEAAAVNQEGSFGVHYGLFMDNSIKTLCSLTIRLFGGVVLSIVSTPGQTPCLNPSGAPVRARSNRTASINVNMTGTKNAAVDASVGFHSWTVLQQWIATEIIDRNVFVNIDGVMTIVNGDAHRALGPWHFIVSGSL